MGEALRQPARQERPRTAYAEDAAAVEARQQPLIELNAAGGNDDSILAFTDARMVMSDRRAR